MVVRKVDKAADTSTEFVACRLVFYMCRLQICSLSSFSIAFYYVSLFSASGGYLFFFFSIWFPYLVNQLHYMLPQSSFKMLSTNGRVCFKLLIKWNWSWIEWPIFLRVWFPNWNQNWIEWPCFLHVWYNV